MAEGEVSVSMRLVLDQLKGDIQKAAAQLKLGLGRDLGTARGAAEQAAGGMDKLERSTRKATSAIKDQHAEFRRQVAATRQIRDFSGASTPGRGGFQIGGTVRMTGGGLATPPNLGGGGYSGPTPPIIAPPIMGGAGGGGGLRGMFSGMNMGYLRGFTVLGGAMIALHRVMGELRDTMRNAVRLNASAFSSGMPRQFLAQQRGLSQATGLSEADAMRYGGAFPELMKELSKTSKIQADNAPVIASLNADWVLLKENMAALWSEVLVAMAPGLKAIVTGAKEMVAALTTMGAVIEAVVNKIFGLIPGGQAVRNVIIGQMLGGFVGSTLAAHGTMAGGGTGAVDDVGGPKRMAPFSAWERMGLVLGGGIGGNPAKETARNTKETVAVLKDIRTSLMPRSGSETENPAYNSP